MGAWCGLRPCCGNWGVWMPSCTSPCFPTNPSPDPELLCPQENSISCRRMEGGCRWPCCIKIIPYKQHNRAFPNGNRSGQTTYFAIPALQTVPRIILHDCQRISKDHGATCHRNAFSKISSPPSSVTGFIFLSALREY